MRAPQRPGHPCMNLSIPPSTPTPWAGNFYFFLFACYLSCKPLGVNPSTSRAWRATRAICFKNLGKAGCQLNERHFLNLKRFDVPVELGRVNAWPPWPSGGGAIVAGAQQGLTGYDPAEAEFVDFFPEAHLIPAAAARTADSRVELGCQGVFRADTAVGGNFGAFTTNRPATPPPPWAAAGRGSAT